MTRILNGLFYFLKFILFVAAFGASLYVMVKMYQRLDKDMLQMIKVFIPHMIILLLFIINMFARQKVVTTNVFFNLTCCLVFFTITLLAVRAIADPYMIYSMKNEARIDFNYFSDSITFINVLIYGLCLGDVFLMFSGGFRKKKKEVNDEDMHSHKDKKHIAVPVKDTL